MKKKLYQEDPCMNLGWCKPLEFSTEKMRIIVTINEGEIVDVFVWRNGRRIHEKQFDNLIRTRFSENAITTALNIDDIDDAKCEELYCSQCPGRTVCDAMDNNE